MSESKRVLELYGDLLEQIASRLEAAQGFLAMEPAWPHARAAATELRGILEHLIYAGLLGNRQALPQAEEALARLDRKSARRLVRKTNPDWWPMPVTSQERSGQLRLDTRTGDDWLREDQWEGFYSKTSSIMHVRNPFVREGPELSAAVTWLAELHSRILNLLTEHLYRPTPQSMVHARLNLGVTGDRVRVDRWAQVRAP